MAEILVLAAGANTIVEAISNCRDLIAAVRRAIVGYDKELKGIIELLDLGLDKMQHSDLPSDENLGSLLAALETDLRRVSRRVREDGWVRRLVRGGERERTVERLRQIAISIQLQVITTTAIRFWKSELWTLKEAEQRGAYRKISKELDGSSIITMYDEETFTYETIDIGPNPAMTTDRRHRLIRIVQMLHNQEESYIATPVKVLQSDKHFFLLSKTSFTSTLRENLHWYDCTAQNNAIMALATAVEAIHECQIVHKRINSFNILADGEGRVKLAGFISSRMLQERSDNDTSTSANVSQRMIDLYQAPERRGYNIASYTTSCDIYSLGIVMFEIIAGRCLYDDESVASGSAVIDIIPSHRLSDIIKLCIRNNAPDRPNIKTVVTTVVTLLNIQ